MSRSNLISVTEKEISQCVAIARATLLSRSRSQFLLFLVQIRYPSGVHVTQLCTEYCRFSRYNCELLSYLLIL